MGLVPGNSLIACSVVEISSMDPADQSERSSDSYEERHTATETPNPLSNLFGRWMTYSKKRQTTETIG